MPATIGPPSPQLRLFPAVPGTLNADVNHILVLYDSHSGNTEKMALLVAEGARQVPDTDVRVRRVTEATPEDIYWCEGLALGSPTNMGLLSWSMKRFWDETMLAHWMKVDGRIGCAFSSAGGWGGGMELACQSLLTLLMNVGFLTFGVTDYAAKLTTAHYGAVTAREPRSDEAQANCRLLGRRLAEWVAVYFHGQSERHPGRHLAERLGPG